MLVILLHTKLTTPTKALCDMEMVNCNNKHLIVFFYLIYLGNDSYKLGYKPTVCLAWVIPIRLWLIFNRIKNRDRFLFLVL